MNNTLPLVSFCLLTYNQEQYIEEAVLGALNQTYQNLEIIISDDCSSDTTFDKIKAVVAKYTGKHKVIINQNERNLGLAAHVNLLTHNISKGEFIALAAGDDISLPARIEMSVEYMLENTETIALSTAITYINGAGYPLHEKNTYPETDQQFDLNHYLANNHFHVNGPSRIFRRSVCEAFGELNSNCPTEDSTYLLRCLILGKVALLKTPLVQYRWHQNNMSAPHNLYKIDIDKIHAQYLIDIKTASNLHKISSGLHEKLLLYISNKKKYRRSQNRKRFYSAVKLNFEKIIFHQNKPVINLWWWRGEKFNFGDELSPYIFEKLFGCKVHNYQENGLYKLKREKATYYLSRILQKITGLSIYLNKPDQRVFMSVGSVLAFSQKNFIVWGSGIISKQDRFDGGNIKAVRGQKTIDHLRQLGVPVPNVVGDPAILLPLIYPSNVEQKFRIGIIPHYVDYDKVKATTSTSSDVVIIDLTNPDIEYNLDLINSCKSIISSSLHGIIVSHAYNIPSVWCRFSDDLYGDDIKFQDYYNSIGIDFIEPEIFSQLTTDVLNQLEAKALKFGMSNSIAKHIETNQKNLLTNSPLPIKINSLAQD